MGEPIRVNQNVSPIVITYRKVLRKPQVKVTRRFVGIGKLISNVRERVRDLFDDLVYEFEREVIDAGESRTVHWAINVADPWDAPGTSDLVAVHTHGVVPPGAMHFEVIQHVRDDASNPADAA